MVLADGVSSLVLSSALIVIYIISPAQCNDAN